MPSSGTTPRPPFRVSSDETAAALPPPGPEAFSRVIAAWPVDRPLAILYSGDPDRPDRARWSLAARPSAVYLGNAAETLLPKLHAAAFRPLVSLSDPSRSHTPPFTPGFLGYVSYDSGRVLEPAAQHNPRRDDRGWPLSCWLRIDDALIYDHAAGAWWGMGAWRELARGLDPRADPMPLVHCPPLAPESSSHAGYIASVRRALEYIRAGDIYQVNLAHRLSASFRGSPRALFSSLMSSARPWYGGYAEFTDSRGTPRAILSASPELFLEFDAESRRITTRPMKGTRRGDADPAELLASSKDQAELNMIVDLMRNDLGRICEFGSVRVEAARELERHGGAASQRVSETASQGGILQTTATVSGVVRGGVSAAEILAATFPGGSVTGAPKIRAMQIIDELEPVRRGPYCGAFGFLADSGRMNLNIAIRTALVTGSTLDYSVGAGIVADSDPEAEWEETLAKAAILNRIEPDASSREAGA